MNNTPRVSLRLGMARALACVPLLPVLAVLSGACSDDLDAARARWNDAGITSYRFDLRTTGFQPRSHARITVVDGAVTAVEELDASTFAPTVATAPTIPRLFDEIASQRGSAKATVKYDDELGFPVRAHFDRGEEGDGFEVTNFARLSAADRPSDAKP